MTIEAQGGKKKRELSPEEKDKCRERLMLAAAAKLKKQILAARADPAAFIEFVWRTPKGERVKLEPFHREWLQLMQKQQRVQIEAAKSHGKTTIVLGFLLWRLGTDPNVRVKLFTQSDEKARERLTLVSDLIRTNKLVKLVFPALRPAPRGVWHKSAIQIDRDSPSKDPSLEVSGVMGSVEGGRADLVILDDISDFRTALVYPQYRETIKKKIYAEILPMLEEDGCAISIGTPHHDQDVIASLRVNPAWHSCIYAVGSDNDPFLPLWPSRWSREKLKMLRSEITPIEYDRAYRLKSVSAAIAIVQQKHIQYYDANLLGDPRTLYCLAAYDLAITDKRQSSYFAGVILLYDIQRNLVFVADAWRARLGFVEQAEALLNDVRLWRPDMVLVEETGYQQALREYLFENAEEPIPLHAVRPGNKSKELRLMATLPMFEAKRVFFNPDLDPQYNPEVAARGDLVGQLLRFTASADKDLGDAFAYGVSMLRTIRSVEDDEDWSSGEGVSTRVSVI